MSHLVLTAIKGRGTAGYFPTMPPTLQQIDVFCTTPMAAGGGIWMGGAGLAAEVNNPAKPYGRMFVATGNGSYLIARHVSRPYSNP